MKKIFSILFVLVLALSFSLVTATPVAADYDGFNNPDYYYAKITNAPSGTFYRQAGLSPDGTKIVAQKTVGTSVEIVVMNADGTGEAIISPGDSPTGDIAAYMNPFWSDDGTAIGFVEVHSANPNKVVVYDIATSTRSYIYQPVTTDVANPDFLGSSKTSIVFWDIVGGSADLFTWDGTTLTNITNTANYKEYEPVSNADGTKIVYWSGETTAEPINTTHTLTYSGGTWIKDVGFTPIADSYWATWTTTAATQIALTVMSSKDVLIYDSTGVLVTDLSGPGYSGGVVGGVQQWNFFGTGPAQGPNGQFVITSNAGRGATPGRDIIIAAPRTALYVDDAGSDSNPGTAAAPFATIQKAINESVAGGTVNVAAGTYVEVGQIVISKNLTIIGEDKETTIIKPAQNTTSSGDSRGWFLVNTGIQFNLSNVTLNGSGHQVWQGIRDKGSGTVANCNFNNIQFNPSGSDYAGTAVVVFGNYNVVVTGCTFTAIGRVGVLYYGTGVTGSTFSNNTYTGKGTGNWLDYGVEVGAGAIATITGNTITNCLGVASVDNSTSAGILVSTYYGAGTTATITSNTLTGNTGGIAVGINPSDTSTVVAHNNNIAGNTNYGIRTTAPPVDASANWWGSTDPSTVAGSISGTVDFTPLLDSGTDTDLVAPGFQPSLSSLTVHTLGSQTGSTGRIQEGINLVSGSTVNVAAGTYNITSNIAISKNISIVGDPVNKPVVRANSSFDTSYGGTSNYFFRADPAVTATINIRNIVLNGSGYNVYGGMRFYPTHSGTIENCVFQNLKEPTGDRYQGFGIVDYGSLTIQNNVFTGIGRVGIWVGGPGNIVSNNVYTGKGVGDWLDYGIEVGYGGVATITGNTITNCLGVALVDNSTSAGILVTTYYGDGTTATITRNTLTGNTEGIAVGYDASDTSTVVAHYNNINGNTDYGIHTTAPTVNATYNWWGSSSGPFHPTLNPTGTGNNVSDYVDFEPWSVVENPTVTTQAATSITNNSTTLNMNFTVGGYASVYVRFAYKKSTDTTWTNTTWVPKTANGTHAASIAGLSSNTQYNFTAQLKYNDVEFGEITLEGATRQFTTLPTPPTVTTQAATSIYSTSTIPILNMNFTVGGYGSVNVRFAYKKSADLTWSDTGWVSKGADGAYFKRLGLLFMLVPSTQYDFKAQLQYDDTVIEGATLHFTTAASGCFIATAAYGTPTAKQIDVLRAFRDEVLLKNAVGSQFVALYYRFSPPIANVIAGNELLRTLVRELLVDPIVHVVQATGDMWRN
jgi:hypothetical protein